MKGHLLCVLRAPEKVWTASKPRRVGQGLPGAQHQQSVLGTVLSDPAGGTGPEVEQLCPGALQGCRGGLVARVTPSASPGPVRT